MLYNFFTFILFIYKFMEWANNLSEKMKNEKKWQEYNIGIEIFPESQSKLWKNQSQNGTQKNHISLDPVKIQTFKTNEYLFFRSFSFVDRRELLNFENYIQSKKSTIINYLKKVDGCPNVSQYQIFEESEFLNLIELKAISINPIQSFYKESIKNIHRKSKYKKSWKIDISKFYDSVYSHSFTWIHDFNDKDILNEIDKHLQLINGRMTHGIPTGPIISKIISEILLTSIMLEIQAQISKINSLDVHIHRFADDFSIYFDEEEEFSNASKIIAKILNKYKLSINKEKYLLNFSQDKELISILKTINIQNYFNDDEEELDITNSYITLDNKIYEFQDKNFAASLAKKIVEEIEKINEDKNLINFYKILLKGVNHELIIKQFLQNEDIQLIKIFLDIIVHYINLSQLQLNIPFMLIKNIFNHYPTNNIIISSILLEFVNELAKIYKKTKSEVQKIFIYDFFRNFDKIEVVQEFLKTDINEALLSSHFLHISQLLESNELEFKKELLEILISEENNIFWPKISEISTKIKRLSEEWIIWIYFTEEEIDKFTGIDLTTKEVLKETMKHKEKIKAFHYT